MGYHLMLDGNNILHVLLPTYGMKKKHGHHHHHHHYLINFVLSLFSRYEFDVNLLGEAHEWNQKQGILNSSDMTHHSTLFL